MLKGVLGEVVLVFSKGNFSLHKLSNKNYKAYRKKQVFGLLSITYFFTYNYSV